jgi:hypothetical protein
MTFHVEPAALRTYAAQLADAKRDAETAKSYVHKWGDFSAHESGLFGMIFPAHRNFVAALDAMLQHLAALSDASDAALKQEATHYEHSDLNAEARVDDSYPAVPRSPAKPD